MAKALGLILTAALAGTSAAAELTLDVSRTLPDAPTRNQADAGSCHSFAATGLVESALYRQYGLRLRLSEADLFVGRIVTDKDYYDEAAAAMRRAQGSGKPPKEVEVSEGGHPSSDVDFVLGRGMATNFAADYATMMLSYRRMRDAEQRTMAGIARDNADYAPGGNSFQKWYFNTFVPLFYDPGAHWAELQTKPQSRKITEMALLGGPENAKRLAAERELVKKALAGFKKAEASFARHKPTSGTAKDPKLCRAAGQKAGAWVRGQLEKGRPVAISMGVGGAQEWGSQPDEPDIDDSNHAFLITGLASEKGKVTLVTRNSWGGRNPGVGEDRFCRIYAAATLTAPNDPPAGDGKPTKAPAGLYELDLKNLARK